MHQKQQPKRRQKLRRDNVIALRVSDDEFEKIKSMSLSDGLTLSSWCREIIKDYFALQTQGHTNE